jgi:hypothetical protein
MKQDFTALRVKEDLVSGEAWRLVKLETDTCLKCKKDISRES